MAARISHLELGRRDNSSASNTWRLGFHTLSLGGGIAVEMKSLEIGRRDSRGDSGGRKEEKKKEGGGG